MARYSIKDLENFTGIKAHTIRMWEKRYGIVEPKRTNTNIRYYNDNDLKKLLNISILNRNGLKISTIVNLDDKTISDEILNLTYTLNDFASQIEGLVMAMIDMDEQLFDKIFNNAVIKTGLEKTVVNIMYPFFRRVGILWQVGTIDTSHERFIAALVRQKLIVAIDSLVPRKEKNPKTFLLFLPENEHHELGLLFFHYLLKKNNYNVIYLGADLPLKCVENVTGMQNISAVLTSVRMPHKNRQFKDFVDELSITAKGKKVFVYCPFLENYEGDLSENVTFMTRPEDFPLIFNV